MGGTDRIDSVWHVSREYGGFAEAGGLKDAVRGLSLSAARAGIRVTVAIPRYGFMTGRLPKLADIVEFNLPVVDQDRNNEIFQEPVKISSCEEDGVRLLFVDSPRFASKRSVYTYTDGDQAENHHKKRGTGHWDFHQMNVLLQMAALEAAARMGETRTVFHCHDGHCAFLPALMREHAGFAEVFKASGAVVTIHNAGQGYHQEVWDPRFAELLTGLAPAVLQKGRLNGTVDPFLLAGHYAILNTVSEEYARELLAERDNEVSGGLGKALRERGIGLAGVTNGVEAAPYDPRDPATGLPSTFDPGSGDVAGKRACKEALFAVLKTAPPPDAGRMPMYAFIGRLTEQKGIRTLHEAIRAFTYRKDSPLFVVLGQGSAETEAMMMSLAGERSAKGRVWFVSGFDTSLANLIYAASDFLLVPSVYEPCGLTDYLAQILGSIPIVHRVGGLAKVRDSETGFSYEGYTTEALVGAVERSLTLFLAGADSLDRMRRTAFREIFSLHTWDRVLQEGYMPLYEEAMRASVRGGPDRS